MRRALTLIACMICSLVVVSVDTTTSQAADDAFKQTSTSSWIAQPVTKTAARVSPGGKIRYRIPTETPWSGEPVSLMVLSSKTVDDQLWLNVRLPIRPNNSSGWILADHAIVTRTRWRAVVSTKSRQVTIYNNGRVKRRIRVVVGKQSTPTPHGTFAIWEKARQPNPRGELGPWALHLTAHSNVLDNYGGGPGRDSFHGRGGALLRDPLGSARSHGCVRMSNTNVSWIANRLPVGTPVIIK